MRVSVTFRHMEHQDKYRKYAEGKISKLKKYLYNPVDANVVLSEEKHRSIAEIVINADRTTIKGKESTNDMYKAIDVAIDKIEKQVKKHKDKLTKRKGDSVRKQSAASVDPTNNTGPDYDDRNITIITKIIDTKPMTIEDAAMQLETSDSEFLVFQNADSKKVNVIYKRNDNKFGHIVPTVKK